MSAGEAATVFAQALKPIHPVSVVDAPPGRRRLQPIPWWQLDELPRREYLVKGLLDRGAFSLLYGPSNCGKTFLALDLACRVAMGWPWRGRRVRRGGVVYIAGEGGLGIAERLAAYSLHHKIATDDVPLYVVPSSVDFCHEDADVAEIVAEVKRICATDPVELIVVDTLSRALAGGNENGPEDMGAFVSRVDRLRQETGAHVLAIHHSGKDAERGARGHNLLLGAIDTSISISRDGDDGPSTATVQKQRDHATGDAYAFTLKAVEIGTDGEGDPIRSCVVDEVECAPVRPAKKAQPSPSERVILDALRKALAAGGEAAPGNSNIPAGVRCVSQDIVGRYYTMAGAVDGKADPLRQFRRGLVSLQGKGWVGRWNEGKSVWLID